MVNEVNFGSVAKSYRYDSIFLEKQKKEKAELNQNISYWTKKLGNPNVARKIANTSKEKGISMDQLNKTFDYIVKIFQSKGFSEEEAVKYINSNVEMMFLSKAFIGCYLAVLNTKSLDETAMFENPNFMVSNNNISNVYGSMRGLSSENREVTLESITSYSKENPEKTREYAAKLYKVRLQALYSSYNSRLNAEYEKKLK